MTNLLKAPKQVVEKAWTDPAFKAQLLADPRAAVASIGMPLPAEMDGKIIKVVDALPSEKENDVLYVLLPTAPDGAQLSDDDLDDVAGGGVYGWAPGGGIDPMTGRPY